MLCPQSRKYAMQVLSGFTSNNVREKRQNRDVFNVQEAVHRSEYTIIKRPKGKSGKPIEPTNKFEVNLESDSFSKEKYSQRLACDEPSDEA